MAVFMIGSSAHYKLIGGVSSRILMRALFCYAKGEFKLEDMKGKLPPDVLEFFRKQGARGGKIGGKRSLETMTPEQRVARAKKAAARSVAVRRKNAKAR